MTTKQEAATFQSRSSKSPISDFRSQISDFRSPISDLRSQISDLRSVLHARIVFTPRRMTRVVEHSFQRLVSLFVVFSLLAVSTPAAPATIVDVGTRWKAGFGFWLRANGLPGSLLTAHNAVVASQEKHRERETRVANIQISPGDVAVNVNEPVNFAAAAYDAEGNTVGGIKIKWSARDRGRGRGARVSPKGEFEAEFPGTYQVVAEGAGRRAQVTVTVNDVPIRRRKDARPIRSVPASTRYLPAEALQRLRDLEDKKDRVVAKDSAASKRRKRLAHAAAPLLPDDGWGDSNYWSADEPGNRIGDTPGAPSDDGAGSGNFHFEAPVLSLSGRGIDVALSLAYNSRLWNKASSQINYDLDRGWPRLGFRSGSAKFWEWA